MGARWEDHAACAGMNPSLFYPEAHETALALEAKRVCAACPVRRLCLEANLGEAYGIWGGTSERQRRKIRKQRIAAARKDAAA